jgi:hypothetical protein
MINIEQLQQGRKDASERAIRIHEALNIPYVTEYQGQVVEMLHGKVLKVITPAHVDSANTPSSDD